METPVAAEDLVLLARSLEIADAAMLDVLTNNCVAQDEHGLTLGLTDANAREVHTLAEADPQIAEAFSGCTSADMWCWQRTRSASTSLSNGGRENERAMGCSARRRYVAGGNDTS